MKNPFSYSDYVTGEAFCNRVLEQKDLIYYAKNSQNILLYSRRRMGKTSLLHQVMRRLKKTRPSLHSIYIDLYGTLDENDFIDAILTGLTQIELKIERIFKQLAGLKITGTVNPETNMPTLSASTASREKPEYLEKALGLVASYSNKRKMLVVFDEFQEVAKYSEEGFEKRLRKALQGHQAISYFFSGSQKHILIDMFDSTKGAFYKMARGYPLAKISRPHYIKWAQKLFRKKHVNLPEKLVSDIVSYCESQPMYIQQFLFDLWRSSVVSEDLLDNLKKSILARQRNQFMVLWDLLTQNQRKALKLLVETGSQGIYTAAQLQRVGFNTGSVLHRALQALIEKEIIYKNNSYQLQDAMFKNWLIQML